MDIETRFFGLDTAECRVVGHPEERKIVGYGAVVNRWSVDLGGFTEMIEPGAFAPVLGDDVRGLFNHDANHVLGRTKSGTLRIAEDDLGLSYDLSPPDTASARDVMTLISRGDVTGNSFSFKVAEDRWVKRDGQDARIISRFARLYDVGPVTFPAYPQTDVALRSLEIWRRAEESGESVELLRRRLRMSELGG